MRHSTVWGIIAWFVASTGAIYAQDAITIKLRERREGDSVRVMKNDKVVSNVKVEDATGKILFEQKENKTEVREYTETILKRTEKKPATKLEREYTKVQTIKGEKTVDGPLQGKNVVIEKTGEGYTFTYKGGEEVTGAAAAALNKEFSSKSDSQSDLDKVMLPKTAVKVGDSWKLDMGPVLKILKGAADMEADGPNAKGTGKLLKTYDKNGTQFGQIQYKIEMPLKAIGKGPMQMKFAPGAKAVMDLSLDVCIDGTSEAGTLNMKMRLTGEATLAQLPGATATLNVVTETRGSQEDAKK